ncbi:MAG: hypothetical protein PHH45_01170 [Patescibacteria group bacterium]|nr:hypothetical protein [Patescibacteria group bacterium]HPL01393.1 hypothetical protein [bacterium]
MEVINTIFSYYDKLLSTMSPTYAGFLSLFVLLALAYSIYNFIKGNIIWIVAIIIFIPATIPALKTLLKILLIIFEFLIIKIKI